LRTIAQEEEEEEEESECVFFGFAKELSLLWYS
jgi:hypothetical protein